MRRKIGRILAPVMAAMLVFGGCGNKTADRVTENQTHKTENESNEPVEKEPAEDEDELKEENQEEQNTQDQETDVEEEEEKAEIPEESTLDIDYTSVDGLRMEKGSRISVVIKNTESDYWKAVKKGMEQAVSDLNEYLGYKGDDAITCTIEGPKDENGVDEQVNILDMVLTENPVVVCLSAVDMSSCEAQLEAAQEDGIPVVMLDSGVKSDDDLVYAYCGTDNKEAGEEAAKQLCEAIKDAGEVAVMSHTQLSQSSKDRVEGFQEEIT